MAPEERPVAVVAPDRHGAPGGVRLHDDGDRQAERAAVLDHVDLELADEPRLAVRDR
jgi:hypothetical protein